MRISDRLCLSIRLLKGGWAVLPALGIAIAAFCLCFAGAIYTKVQDEMSLPYELEVMAQGNAVISESMLAEIEKTEDVTAVTALLSVPVTVQTGTQKAELTLTGMDAGYMEDELKEGANYTDEGVMPYIVINEAALKKFTDSLSSWQQTEEMQTEDTQTDWLSASYALQMGDSRPIVAKVCGILPSEKDASPEAYISLSAAKQLLQKSGQKAAYTAVKVRVTNIGCAPEVSRGISAHGLSVANSGAELEAGWDADMKEMGYLLAFGLFGLVCAAVLMTAWRRLALTTQRRAYEALLWMGLSAKQISMLFVFQALVLSLVGTAVGILVALSLPSFLTGEAPSNFMLQAPFIVVFGSAAICIAAGIASVMSILTVKHDKG